MFWLQGQKCSERTIYDCVLIRYYNEWYGRFGFIYKINLLEKMSLSELVASMSSRGNDRLGYSTTVKDQIDNI